MIYVTCKIVLYIIKDLVREGHFCVTFLFIFTYIIFINNNGITTIINILLIYSLIFIGYIIGHIVSNVS